MGRAAAGFRWLLLLLSLTVLLSAFAGCGARSVTTTASSPPGGHLTGVVYLRGSTIRDTPIEVTLTITLKGDPSRSYTTDSGSDGSFGIDLPPGSYDITGIVKANGRGAPSPHAVSVQGGKTTTITLSVYQP